MYTSYFFSMKILNKLADADALACGRNILKDRRLWCFILNPVPANSNEKNREVGTLLMLQYAVNQLFLKNQAYQLVRKKPVHHNC